MATSATALAKAAVDEAGSSHYNLYDLGNHRGYSALGRSNGLGETLRQAGDVLRLALDEVKFWTKRTVRIERFEKALKEADLEQMKFWHGKLGSLDLARGHFDVFEARYETAMDVFVAQWVLGRTATAWSAASSEARSVDVREHIAWLQGHGARFSQPEREGRDYDSLWLAFLIGQGLDMTGVTLGEVESDMRGHCFLGPAMFVQKLPVANIMTFLGTGAGMWPLDLPGASADAPPPGFSFPSAEDPDDPDDCYDGVEYNQLSLFWPDQFPRRPADDDDEWPQPQVEEISDSVTAVCSFFAGKREKERRDDAWARRRLAVLYASTMAGKWSTKSKRRKLAETGLAALVRGVAAQQLWRDVVAFL